MIDVSLGRAAAALRSGRRVLVTCHPNPDGDAVGSMLALWGALRDKGVDCVAYNPDPIPHSLHFLDGAQQIVRELPSEAFDLTVVLDCSDARMFPHALPDRAFLGKVLVVDHHQTRGEVWDEIYADVNAASVGVLLYRLFRALKWWPQPLAVCEALYCSVLSDTGSFRYQNTDPEALKIAAELISNGVDPWRVASNLYETRPVRQLELLTRVLQTLVVSEDGHTAILTVTEEMLRETGCTADMVDGFVNYARALQGVQVALLFRQSADGIRVSMRSRGTVNVAQIAQGFGGGGHHNAAGFSVEDDDAQALQRALFDRVGASLDSAPALSSASG
ncbi:MAG: DHH family phosphoesterase [Deltaproteobacteria bacterium]|nr:DHH family phosphoesterase [Deltaproteobacteria bacterium]